MKKVYSKPETLYYFIEMQQIICESITGTNAGLGVKNNSTGITEGNSRRNNFWDDEE